MRARILAEIRSSVRPPTNRELATALNIGENAVRRHTAILVQEGLLIRDQGVARGLRLPQVTTAARHASDEHEAQP